MIGVFRISDKLGQRLVLILKSYPCSWGKCVFCPFALEQSVDIKEIIRENTAVIKEALMKLREEDVGRVAVVARAWFLG